MMPASPPLPSAYEALCLDDLDDDALDRLPFGVVCLNADGTVARLNCIEAERSGTKRWRAIGRDYFRDVVGLPAKRLAGTVRSVAPGTSERTFHTFHGSHRTDDAYIDIFRDEAGRVHLRIRATSRPIHAAGATGDADANRSCSPSGSSRMDIENTRQQRL